MVLTADGCGNCSSAAWRYLDSMLHREGPQARLDIARAAAANAASRKPLQAKAAINVSALQAPECFSHLHSGLPPAIGKATAGGKTAKRQHGMWESGLGRLAGMARQKNQYHAEWRQGGIELSRHPGPTQYAHGAGRCPIGRSSGGVRYLHGCRRNGAIRPSWPTPADLGDGMRGRGRRRGYKKNAARPGMNPAGGNMKGGGILLSRIAAQYHRRNRA